MRTNKSTNERMHENIPQRADKQLNQQVTPLIHPPIQQRQQFPHDDDARLLSDAVAQQVIDRVINWCGKQDRLDVRVQSAWSGGQRWARNRAFLTSNVRTIVVAIRREAGVASSAIMMNQVDDDSLRAACAYVEAGMARKHRPGVTDSLDLALAHPILEAKGIPVWSDATYHRTAAENARAAVEMTERAESNGMLSAGFFETTGASVVEYRRDGWGRVSNVTGRATFAQCSSTVRHPKGVGSGWAGASSFDLPRLDLAKLGEIAFDKCLRSMNPVRIEPGRYQTILEPNAVASFATAFFNALGRGDDGERATGVHWLGYDAAIRRHRSKLGLQIMDRRLTVSHDPEDPITGTIPVPGMRKIDFVTHGVLTTMFTDYRYALPEQNSREFAPERNSFVMRGTETTTMDEMISTMKRGLLVTRFSDMTLLDKKSLLCTGFTRDGLWLIENGKITKAVRNFRFTESPLFAFNNVESIGEPVPVMSPFYGKILFPLQLQRAVPSVMVPPLKVNDFSFTSTVDAV